MLLLGWVIAGLGCSPNKSRSSETPPAEVGPRIEIVRPSNGATVTGWASLEAQVTGTTKGHKVAWRFDGERVIQKSFTSELELKTSASPAGPHTIAAEVYDANGTVASDQITLVFANPAHELLSYRIGSDTYTSGQTLEVWLTYSQPGLHLDADLSALDSAFDASKVITKELGGGEYLLNYPISPLNTNSEGNYRITVSATGPDKLPTSDGMDVRLLQHKLIPFWVQSAVLVDSTMPAVTVDAALPAPKLTTKPVPFVNGNTWTMAVHWDQPPGDLADRLWVAAKGTSGYFVLPVPTGAQDVEITLNSLKPDASGALEVQIVPVSANGLTSGIQTTTIQVANLGRGGIQLTLFWDAPVDLDLSVVDPQRTIIDYANPKAHGGLLNMDSNAVCAINKTFAENISWTATDTPIGDYQIRISMFDKCGYDGPVHWWIVGTSNSTSNMQFKPGAGGAGSGAGMVPGAEGTHGAGGITTVRYSGTITSTDTEASKVGGMTAGPPVTVDTAQSVGGVVSFKKNPEGKFTDERARFVPVRAVSAVDGTTTLGETVTSSDGSYSMTLNNPKNIDYRLIVEAAYSRAASAGAAPTAQVTDHGGASVHTATGPVIPVKPGTTQVHHLVILPDNNAGAFNILDMLRRGYEWVYSSWPRAPLGVMAARWERGVDSSTWYVQGEKYMEIRGSTNDPDEFDDSVILHEFNHYVYLEALEKPAPGGEHSVTVRSAPDLAFSEGLATAVGQRILKSPVYIDKLDDNVRVGRTNLETNSSLKAKGQDPKTILGNVSELLISMVIWDLFDGVDAKREPADTIDAAAMTAVTFLRGLKSRPDRGASGTDLVDFLDGWRCRSGADASGVFAQDSALKRLLTEREFNYDFIGNPTCP